MKKIFIEQLRYAYLSIGRGNIGFDGLIGELETGGFFTAPCSTQYHLCKEGGLLEHSLNVEEIARKLAIHLGYEPIGSVSVTALLHDIGKMGQFGKTNYITNMVKDGRPTKTDPEQKYKISESKPYASNPDLIYVPHEIRSVQIASRYLDLTEEESFAILQHNGMYGDLKYSLNGKETPLQMIIHFADMWASRVVENVKESETIE
ncbi:HD domain-containing protein [Clostridium sp.]|uniref:HD domain-containing protein n=1 Tax=Clostridium sp. TaxID=1506 RepID=UPI00284D57FE|nr:HD domain-containing protein [Clostridium sp.]MDR3595137.1 HD domain-containing protein [Clostridium sp.]